MIRQRSSAWLAVAIFVFSASSLSSFASRTTPPAARFVGAAYLNPDSGRFWTMDSFEGRRSDPLSLHRYLYCHLDPVGRIDPSGRDDIDASMWMVNLNSRANEHRFNSWFIGAFTKGPLGRKLLGHYLDLSGTKYTLSIDEMVEAGARYRRDESAPSIAKAIDFDQSRQRLSSGSVQITEARLLLVATQPATLGHFTAYLNGTLSGSTDDWTFQGTMRFSDTYNFEYHKGGGLQPREVFCFGVRNFLSGKDFDVTSEAAPVKQTSNEEELQWKGTGKRYGGTSGPDNPSSF